MTYIKKIVLFILALFFAAGLSAQTEPANYSIALNKFKQFYNAGQPDSVFAMFSPEMKTALPLDKFTATTTQLKTQLGYLTATSFVKYNDPLAVYKATFQNSVFLLNLALNSQNQLTGLLLKPQEEPQATVSAQLDPSLTESPISLKTLSGSVSGTLTMPKDAQGKIPVVLIIAAGRGPIDRNGNNPAADLNANVYKLLAYDLGKSGIASVRYDKRLVGESVSNQKESELSLDDYVDDAVGLINMLHDDGRFSKVILVGHGDGSLVGMRAAFDEPADALISIEGAGQPAEKILSEQIKVKPDYQQDEFKVIMDSLRKGKVNPNVDPALYSVIRPSIQPYIMSWCRYDPTREIRQVKVPILIIQGSADLQVSEDNALKLKNAKSGAKLSIIKGMNYVLKDAPADKDANMATYKDPDLPLKPELVSAIVDFVKGLE